MIDNKAGIAEICDLHTHSNFSDGSLTPTALVELAVSRGLSAIALTDHNTVDGLPYFLRAGEGKDIRLIPGIEFSTEWRGIEIHVIALGVAKEQYPAVRALVGEMRKRKREAVESLIDALIQDGYLIDKDRITEGVAGQINRAHVATELVRCGYVETRSEAFEALVSANGKYYRAPRMLDTKDTVAFIKSIGAVSVLAHPLLNVDERDLWSLLSEIVPAGLDAIEVIYSEYDEDDTALSYKIAEDFGLLPSGGSDYHGKNKPDIQPGCGKGNLIIPLTFPKNMGLLD